MTAPLSGEGLSYAVGGKSLLREVSLSLEAGTVTGVVGPNGAGKSTLLRLLAGELVPDRGSVRICGEPLRSVPAWRLACLRAVLPQTSRLAFPFSVAEVVRIGQDGIGRGLDRAARAAIVAEAMRQADVAPLAARNYATLSGGEGQRVQFARVLAQLAAGRTVAPTQILLLDEPTASLDLKHQLGLLAAARRLAGEGLAVLTILHDLNLAAAFADRIVVLRDGVVAAEGPPVAVLTDRMLREVFDVALSVGAVPGEGRPFLLPHGGQGLSDCGGKDT